MFYTVICIETLYFVLSSSRSQAKCWLRGYESAKRQGPWAEEGITYRKKTSVDTGFFAHFTLHRLLHSVHCKYGVCRFETPVEFHNG